jgi:sugar/nucleoside kinase (ribokinase family)
MNTSKQLDVVVAGLAVADIIGRPIDLKSFPKRGGLRLIEGVTLTTGGNVSNVGIDLAKLGFRVGAITRVGSDSLGRFILQQYRAYGIETEGVTIDAKRQSSATMVCVAKDGERTFLHTRGCMANFRASDVLEHLPLISKAYLFAFGYLGLLPETEKEFKTLFETVKEKTAAKILLDTAGVPRSTKGALKKFLPFVDYFVPSFQEAQELTGKRTPEGMVKVLRSCGATGFVGIKLGAKGAYVSGNGESRYLQAPRVRRVVDATGAGDAFVAGLLAAIIRGYGVSEATSLANAVAASCVTAVGASTAIRSFESYLKPSQISRPREHDSSK